MVSIMATMEYLAVNIALHYNTMSKVTLQSLTFYSLPIAYTTYIVYLRMDI